MFMVHSNVHQLKQFRKTRVVAAPVTQIPDSPSETSDSEHEILYGVTEILMQPKFTVTTLKCKAKCLFLLILGQN